MRSPLVLVVRESDKFSELLREGGCRVANVPATATEPLNDLSDARSLIEDLAAYDGLFITSPAAADVFLSMADRNAFRGKAYVLGDRARKSLKNAGFRVEANRANNATELIGHFGLDEFSGKRFLFVRGERSMRTIPDALANIAHIDEAVVYRTLEKEIDADAFPNDEPVDWICFFSPSGVEAFTGQVDHSGLSGALAAAIGTTTAKSAEELGYTVGFVSETANAAEFAKGLLERVNSIE